MQSSIYFSAIIILLFWVILRGSFPERAIVGIILLADVLDQIYHAFYGPSDFRTADLVHVALDFCAFLGVLWVALGANRFWPLAVCSLHLLGMTGHAAMALNMPGYTQAYWAMTSLTDFIQLPIIAAGVWMHDRRRRLIGPYRDWRPGWSALEFPRSFGQRVNPV